MPELPLNDLALRMTKLATLRTAEQKIPYTEALRNIAGEMRAEDGVMAQIRERNSLLSIQKSADLESFVGRFKTPGEGLLAKLQGTHGIVEGSRDSIDYKAKAIDGQYFGQIVLALEKEGLDGPFKKMDDDLALRVYQEMGAMEPGKPAKSVTGDDVAFRIAQLTDELTGEMVARQNRAGAYINRMPGYVMRQTHDMQAIRNLGDGTRSSSFKEWSDFILPRLDHDKTFKGADANEVLDLIHQELYSGVYGASHTDPEISIHGTQGALAAKISASRKLHFKSPEAAFEYNQSFGIRDFKEALMSDIHNRARSIALMEELGPNPLATFEATHRRMLETARSGESAAEHVDSLKDWRIGAAWDEVTGRSEVPNPAGVGLNRFMTTTKIMLQLAKMGAVTLSSFSDRAFLQSEMAYQGISHLQTLGKQLSSFIPRGVDKKQHLRLMGVAMDGLKGNALSRYSSTSTVSGWLHTLQKKFFDLNGLNLWTDASKAAAAELMSAHLGEHAHLPHGELPGDLTKVLSLYDISSHEWDALRHTAYDHNDAKFITPDKVREIPDEVISKLVERRDLKPSKANILRMRDQLETKLRTYFMDRVDYAVPTPGAAERKYATLGTQAGTPLGEAVRAIMLFKSFPITIMNKVVGRNVYGNGAQSVGQWLLKDKRGVMNMAMLMAMGTALGYVSGAVRDTLKGRNPKPLVLDDGTINMAALNDAALRGGSLGIMGDVLLSEYDRGYKSFLGTMAGPVLGQLDEVARLKSLAQRGEFSKMPDVAGKLAMDNSPFINLFYIRPVLDYLVLWHLEEMMNPGAMGRMESAVQSKNKQTFWLKPTEVVKEKR